MALLIGSAEPTRDVGRRDEAEGFLSSGYELEVTMGSLCSLVWQKGPPNLQLQKIASA